MHEPNDDFRTLPRRQDRTITLRDIELAARFELACKGRSNRALGRLLGVSYESVRRYRRGEGHIPALVAADLCRVHRVSLEWLLKGTGESGLNGQSLAKDSKPEPCDEESLEPPSPHVPPDLPSIEVPPRRNKVGGPGTKGDRRP